MPNLKFLIIGRSGSGKDTLRTCLEKRGFSFVKSATTRPKRNEDEDTHLFVDDGQMQELLEDAIATTVIDGNTYCATNAMFDASDAYIIDPKGAFELFETQPERSYRLLYVSAPTESRLAAAVGRADDAEAARATFESRNADEDVQFSDFEELLKNHPEDLPKCVTAFEIYENDFTMASMEEQADYIFIDKNFHDNIERLLRLAIDNDLIADSEQAPMRVNAHWVEDPCRFAEVLSQNRENLANFVATMFSLMPLDIRMSGGYGENGQSS